MITENSMLMRNARSALSGKWGRGIGVCIVYLIVGILFELIPILGNFLWIMITAPMYLGLCMYFLAFIRNESPELNYLFKGMNNYITGFITYWLPCLYALLWLLLFIIPGIIAFLSYSQALFIVADDPGIRANDAIKKSKQMMYGYKKQYFFLGLRMAVLGLLCILTLGIGFIWLMPYAMTCFALFYEEVKKSYEEKENVVVEEGL